MDIGKHGRAYIQVQGTKLMSSDFFVVSIGIQYEFSSSGYATYSTYAAFIDHMLADWNMHLAVDLDEPSISEENPAMVMADQCGVHCNFNYIMKWKMAHVHHIFYRGHQSSVL